MTMALDERLSADEIAGVLQLISPAYEKTPLLDLPRLARTLGVAQVLAKDEGFRTLGNFKSLGGTYASLRALARIAKTDIKTVLARKVDTAGLPDLICASDGNHGLAVAAAAHAAGTRARIFLHTGVPQKRADRITAQGARIVWIEGTYDDAVEAAAEAAREGGLLIADTSDDPGDPVVADVLAGYGVMAAEIRQQVVSLGWERPTHLFVQAGVGGLAGAMAEALARWLDAPAKIIVVEPEKAACVDAALKAHRLVRIGGDLETSAEMLSCGRASAVAMDVLVRHKVEVVTVTEQALDSAPRLLSQTDGSETTPSGAAGLAGLVTALGRHDVSRLQLGANSRVLLFITEGAV
jgi:diaminopropionate ammonia-lyase